MFKSLSFKRIVAYFLDIIFVGLLVSSLASISFINPDYDEYEANALEFTNYMEETEDIETIYTSDEYIEFQYNSANYGKVNFIITAVIYFAYFVFFQKYNNGQTLGKKIFKIKVVDKDSNNVSLINIIIRSLFIHTILSQIILFIFIMFMNAENYLFNANIVNNAFSVILIICLITMMIRPDKRGIHDLIGHTEVIEA